MNTIEDVSTFLSFSKDEKKRIIKEKANQLGPFGNEIDEALALSKVMNEFLHDYFLLRAKWLISVGHDTEKAILSECNSFYRVAYRCIDDAISELPNSHGSNLYGMSEVASLTVSNKIIRSLNAKMGLLWERLATMSPNAISPEHEFGIKIKGVDLIVLNPVSNELEYTQLKTQKNTLTGSQSGRVVNELRIHDSPVFAAAFDLGSWTFPGGAGILKISGKEFWYDRLSIEYDFLCGLVKNLLTTCEGYLISALPSQ